jgi:ABC-type transport system involved in cytochrome c biogenesis permease subunit
MAMIQERVQRFGASALASMAVVLTLLDEIIVLGGVILSFLFRHKLSVDAFYGQRAPSAYFYTTAFVVSWALTSMIFWGLRSNCGQPLRTVGPILVLALTALTAVGLG